MTIYAHKLLPILISPLGILMLLIGMGLLLRKWHLIALCLGVLMITASPITAHILWTELESHYKPRTIKSLGQYDAVVVLSGGLSTHVVDGQVISEWSDPDRFFAGIKILRSGKSEKLIFTRGKLPWSNSIPEGEVLRKKAIEFGIEKEQILLTEVASNTEQEVIALKKLIETENMEHIVLVTSSFHMPRAALLLQAQGIAFEPFPVDFKATSGQIHWLSLLPSAQGFNRTSDAVREYIGRCYYWLKFVSLRSFVN